MAAVMKGSEWTVCLDVFVLYRWNLAAAGKRRPTAGWRNPPSCPVCCGTGARGEASDTAAAEGRKRGQTGRWRGGDNKTGGKGI